MNRYIIRKFIKILAIWIALSLIPTIIVMISGKNAHSKDETNREGITRKVDGQIIVVTHNDDVTFEMKVEEFIPCVIAAQMDLTSSEETLKAFAVVIRTYIYSFATNNKVDKVDAYNLKLPYIPYEKMESYFGDDFEKSYKLLINVVDKTSNEKIYYNDELIEPYYHAVSNGKTRNMKDVDATLDTPYLKSVNCDSDMVDKEYLKFVDMSYEEFAKALLKYRSDIDISKKNPLEVVSIIEKDEGGYISEIQVGNIVLRGEQFMDCFGLVSPCFSVNEYDGSVRIITKGCGHGLGMSIAMAREMGKEGKKYTEIIKYFYNGVRVV